MKKVVFVFVFMLASAYAQASKTETTDANTASSAEHIVWSVAEVGTAIVVALWITLLFVKNSAPKNAPEIPSRSSGKSKPNNKLPAAGPVVAKASTEVAPAVPQNVPVSQPEPASQTTPTILLSPEIPQLKKLWQEGMKSVVVEIEVKEGSVRGTADLTKFGLGQDPTILFSGEKDPRAWKMREAKAGDILNNRRDT
jgi:hypothetical protein